MYSIYKVLIQYEVQSSIAYINAQSLGDIIRFYPNAKVICLKQIHDKRDYDLEI